MIVLVLEDTLPFTDDEVVGEVAVCLIQVIKDFRDGALDAAGDSVNERAQDVWVDGFLDHVQDGAF